MLIIGVDFHTRFQQIAMLDTETGEVVERRLDHSNGEAKKFYAELQKPVAWACKQPATRNGSRQC